MPIVPVTNRGASPPSRRARQRLNQVRVPRSLRYALLALPPLEFPNRLQILGLSTPFFVTFNVHI